VTVGIKRAAHPSHDCLRTPTVSHYISRVSFCVLCLELRFLARYSTTRPDTDSRRTRNRSSAAAMQWRINIPPLTRLLLVLLFGVSSIYQITRFAGWTSPGDPDFLGLIPQWSVFYPWVVITATFAEQNILTLLIAAGTVLYGGKYLERAWDTREFGKFMLVVTLLPNIAAAFIYVLWFAIARDDDHVYAAPIRFFCFETDPIVAGSPFKAPSLCRLHSWWHLSSLCRNTP
jgi:hypothetical protein